ncbi:hypothetical protein GSY69_06925 [Brevibacterium sp. 5221]|uniref:Helix-turn-helix domain-containing protein n=1 Tax=Brevibacterium rongguiense TaxID=2695267 RepID=A0A6N9H6L3_9MICO|nr:helix-turn-helix domain-containing protein [Brevibacterium rongguiense]MYM19708.1 hypothetical protein [Brevibacterium rongguiense]
MSVQALNWARQMGAAADLPAAQLLLLWLLADQANGQWECWPGVARLARESNQSDKSVKRHLRALEEHGIIVRYARRGSMKNHETGEVYVNVRKSDLIVLQAEALAALAQREEAVAVDESESFGGWVAGHADDEEGHGDNLSPSPGTPETSEGDNLSPSLRVVETQGDNLSPWGHGDNLSPSPAAPETSEGDNLSPWGARGQNEQGLGDKSPRVHAGVNRARGLNPHKEPSSSSSSRESYSAESAGDGRDDDAIAANEGVGGSHRGVSLHALDGVVAQAVGWECTSEQLMWLVDVILDRSARPVGRPARFVTAAVKNDPAAIREELAGRFGRPGSEAASAPAAVGCPIPEHAEQGLLAVNCPACRKWRDFPPRISAGVLDRLDAQIRRHVLDREDVAVVDDESQRTG